MPNIFHQSVEDILKAATPEQKIIWNDIFLRYGERISVSQLYIKGNLGELNQYVARRMYLAYQLTMTDRVTGGFSASFARVEFYDEDNVMQNMAANLTMYWDATAAAVRVASNILTIQNALFSRIVGGTGYTGCYFIGYRIIY